MDAFTNGSTSNESLWTESHLKRTIVLVDMDCFYVQVEQRRDPSLNGKPCAVVQYNDWKGGGIIAVDYIARAKGVSRRMRGEDAQKVCPEIILCKVPVVNGKADLTRYREAGAEVINVLSQFGGRVERASIDEAYIDLSDVVAKKLKCDINANDLTNTFVEGWTDGENEIESRATGIKKWCDYVKTREENNCFRKLALAADITENIRAAVFQQTGFRCSAGISHNKMLAKLCCGLHKPNKQTVLPYTSIDGLFTSLQISKIRHLGGKLGVSLSEAFQVKEIGQVRNIPLQMLIETFGNKTGVWLHEVCHGIDREEVKERHILLSIGCGKNFPGQACLNTREKVITWCEKLMIELSQRLFKDKAANNRIAKTLTTNIKLSTGQSLSRSCQIYSYEVEKLSKDFLSLLQQVNKFDSRNPQWSPSILSLHACAKNFNTFGKLKGLNFNGATASKSACKPETAKVSSESTTSSNNSEKTSAVVNKKTGADGNVCQIDKALKTYFTKPSPTASSDPTLKKEVTNVKRMTPNQRTETSTTQPLKRNRTKTPTKNETKNKNTILKFLSPKSNLKESAPKRPKFENREADIQQKSSSSCSIPNPESAIINQTLPVPLGFFHKKSKFANAVKSALCSETSHANTSNTINQALPTTSHNRHSNNELIDITNQPSTAEQVLPPQGVSLWSDFSENEIYCEKCDCAIPSWEAPDHKSFHRAVEAGQIL